MTPERRAFAPGTMYSSSSRATAVEMEAQPAFLPNLYSAHQTRNSTNWARVRDSVSLPASRSIFTNLKPRSTSGWSMPASRRGGWVASIFVRQCLISVTLISSVRPTSEEPLRNQFVVGGGQPPASSSGHAHVMGSYL